MAWTPELIEERLSRSLPACVGVEGAMVVNQDATVAAAVLPEDVDQDHLGQLVAQMLPTSKELCARMGHGDWQYTLIRYERGIVLLLDIDESAMLAAILERDARLGASIHDSRRLADYIGRLRDS